MRAVTLFLAFNAALIATHPPLPGQHIQEVIPVTVISLNSSGLPVSIKAATAETEIVNSWLEFTVTNASSEEISELLLLVITLNSENQLVTAQAGFHEPIGAGSTRKCGTLIDRPVGSSEQNFVLVTKARSDSGVWSVDVNDLAEKARLAVTRPHVDFPSRYEPHTVLSKRDQTRIFELILKDMVTDPEKAANLGTTKRILIFKEDLNFALPKISSVQVTPVNFQEVQRIAEKEKRTVFLRLEPPRIEGTRVQIRIVLNDRERSTGERIIVPFRFSYLFTCIKSGEDWRIERSIGYS